MTIKITPSFDNDGPAEKAQFAKLIQQIELLGYSSLPMWFDDGSALMRTMTEEEKETVRNLSTRYQTYEH